MQCTSYWVTVYIYMIYKHFTPKSFVSVSSGDKSYKLYAFTE